MEAKWVKSSFSAQSNCLEVRPGASGIHIRESEFPNEVVCTSDDNWLAFVAGVKAGEFDLADDSVQRVE